MRFERIVGLGLAVIDQITVVDDARLRSVRTRARERVVCPGGMVATALAQAAQLGCRAQLVSLVGDDDDGRWLLRELRRLGVSTRHVVRSANHPTGTCSVIVDRTTGERRFIVADRRSLERKAPALDLSPITSRSLLLVDGHFSRQALHAVRRARERRARVIADFSQPRREWLALLPYVDFPIVPQEFARTWQGGRSERTLRALHAVGGGTPVVTLGERGAVALIDGRIRRFPARRVRVRDTTGAGDVYHGAFAAGLARGLELPAALRLAARAAGLCCTALGGTGRLLREAEL